MSDYKNNFPAILPNAIVANQQVTNFLKRVYGWMFIGLAVTAGVAMFIASQPAVAQMVATNSLLFYGLVTSQLALVWWLSARVNTLAPSTAAALFMLYSAANGVTLSLIMLIYTGTSIATAFFTAAAMFGALAFYGSITNRSLAGVGQFAFMGLIGVVIASVVGLFWQNSMLQFVLSVAGVIVFTGLTAYDAQRLKAMALQPYGAQMGSYAIAGALALYLDFINLFLMLLRLFGNRRS